MAITSAELRQEFVAYQFGFHQFSDHYSVVAEFAAKKAREANSELIELLSGMSDILEHDCDCPPCIGSMAPAEDLLGRARALLTKLGAA